MWNGRTYCELFEGAKGELCDSFDHLGHFPKFLGRAFENARKATEGAADLHRVDGSLGANSGSRTRSCNQPQKFVKVTSGRKKVAGIIRIGKLCY